MVAVKLGQIRNQDPSARASQGSVRFSERINRRRFRPLDDYKLRVELD